VVAPVSACADLGWQALEEETQRSWGQSHRGCPADGGYIARTFKTALGVSFRRIARHKGGAVAVFATARQLARLIYRMLRYGHDYVDIGEKAYDYQFQIRRLPALTETAKTLGYTLVPNVAAG
jgi:hypothetical protein